MLAFEDWLTAELDARDMSMSALGRAAGVSHATVSQVLSAKQEPTADFVIRVALALGEDVNALLALAGLIPPQPPAVTEEREVVALVRGMDPHDRDAAIRMLRGLAAGGGRPSVPPQVATERIPTEVEALLDALSLRPDLLPMVQAFIRGAIAERERERNLTSP